MVCLVFRAAAETTVAKYADSFFDSAKMATAVYGSADGMLHIAISARNVNLPAYWYTSLGKCLMAAEVFNT